MRLPVKEFMQMKKLRDELRRLDREARGEGAARDPSEG